MKNITVYDVLDFLATADLTDTHRRMVTEAISNRIKQKAAQVKSTLRIGDRVRWTGKYGTTLTGTVVKMGRTRIHVNEEFGGRWSVSASLLTKV